MNGIKNDLIQIKQNKNTEKDKLLTIENTVFKME